MRSNAAWKPVTIALAVLLLILLILLTVMVTDVTRLAFSLL